MYLCFQFHVDSVRNCIQGNSFQRHAFFVKRRTCWSLNSNAWFRCLDADNDNDYANITLPVLSKALCSWRNNPTRIFWELGQLGSVYFMTLCISKINDHEARYRYSIAEYILVFHWVFTSGSCMPIKTGSTKLLFFLPACRSCADQHDLKGMMSNRIGIKLWDVISQLCHTLNSSLDKGMGE